MPIICTDSQIITLYNVCAVPWGAFSTVGVFSTVGDIMSTMGRYLEYCGGVQYRGGYHDKCGGYLENRGVFSTMGDIMSTVGVTLSTVGDVQYGGRYHDARRDIMSAVKGVQYRGGKVFCYLSTPWY